MSLDDSASQIYADAAWLQGAMVTAALYGVVVVLSVTCWRALWPHIQPGGTGYRITLLFFCYVTFLFLIGTVYVVSNLQVTQSGFIDNRFYPEGPSAYEESNASLPLNCAFVLSSWCADFVMIWRCMVVYRNTKVYPIIVGLGITLFGAAVITGTFWLARVSNSSPTPTDLNGRTSFRFLCPFLSVDLIINIVVSLVTVTRLLYYRRRISKVLGPGHGAIYASFAAMLIESASVYSICSLLYLIPYALDSPISYAFMQMLGEVQIIAPLLIIYHIAEGKGWTDHATPPASATNDAIQIRQMTHPNASTTVIATPSPLNVEITFHTETIRDDGSIKLPRVHRYTADICAPVASAA